MKNCRLLAGVLAVAVAAVSCSQKASVSGSLTGAPGAEVIVKELDNGSFKILDTLKTDANGGYSYKLDVKKDQPLFVYLYKDDTKLASLLLSKGDKVRVVSDTLGVYSVEGSEDCEKLRESEAAFSAFMHKFAQTAENEDFQALSRQYVDYYRSVVQYVLENSKSLAVIPVLYQKINDNFPVFSQATDAIHFKNVYDSLKTVYPDSKYVAALGMETDKRMNLLKLNSRLQNVEERSYPDIELPSIDGSKKKLSDVEAKVVMVYFWQAADAAQKMFNQDAILPLYRQYHSKGFEIYAVSLDTDKGVWASAVRNQELPWVNVCDGMGPASPAALTYNINKGLPVSYFIVDGQLVVEDIKKESDLRRVLSANLK